MASFSPLSYQLGSGFSRPDYTDIIGSICLISLNSQFSVYIYSSIQKGKSILFEKVKQIFTMIPSQAVCFSSQMRDSGTLVVKYVWPFVF